MSQKSVSKAEKDTKLETWDVKDKQRTNTEFFPVLRNERGIENQCTRDNWKELEWEGLMHLKRNKACTKEYVANMANAAIPQFTCSNMWTNRGYFLPSYFTRFMKSLISRDYYKGVYSYTVPRTLVSKLCLSKSEGFSGNVLETIPSFCNKSLYWASTTWRKNLAA